MGFPLSSVHMSLHSCLMCSDCEHCKNCNGCSKATSCHNCVSCKCKGLHLRPFRQPDLGPLVLMHFLHLDISHSHSSATNKNVDCTGCRNCTRCKDSTYCQNCTDCDDCSNCHNCTSYDNCKECRNCTDCQDCTKYVAEFLHDS
jgi:hypothetical protein